MRLKGERGFTLVELLIVISIVGIILAIIIPNLIQHSRSSDCKEKAIGWKVIEKNSIQEVIYSPSDRYYGDGESVEYYILLESPKSNTRCIAFLTKNEWIQYVAGDTYPRMVEEP